MGAHEHKAMKIDDADLLKDKYARDRYQRNER
jgi:hypothetical protein